MASQLLLNLGKEFPKLQQNACIINIAQQQNLSLTLVGILWVSNKAPLSISSPLTTLQRTVYRSL